MGLLYKHFLSLRGADMDVGGRVTHGAVTEKVGERG